MTLAREEFGIAVSSAPDSWKVAQRAEQLGFGFVWFSDSPQLNADLFVSMSLAAAGTSHIQLGTGVLVPGLRTSVATASGLASLNALAPGRLHFGVGTGYTARRAQGLGAATLKETTRYIEEVEGLLRGEAVMVETPGGPRLTQLLTSDRTLLNVEDPVRLHISAMGPGIRRLAAERGAGWLTFPGMLGLALEGMTDMRMSWGNCGNAPGSLHSTIFSLGRILERGESVTSDLALAQAGPFVASFFHDLVETTSPGELTGHAPPVVTEALEIYREFWSRYEGDETRYLANHEGHLMFLRPEERQLLNDELIQMLTLTGSPSYLRERIDELRRGGFSQIVIHLTRGHEDEIDRWADLFDLR